MTSRISEGKLTRDTSSYSTFIIAATATTLSSFNSHFCLTAPNRPFLRYFPLISKQRPQGAVPPILRNAALAHKIENICHHSKKKNLQIKHFISFSLPIYVNFLYDSFHLLYSMLDIIDFFNVLERILTSKGIFCLF